LSFDEEEAFIRLTPDQIENGKFGSCGAATIYQMSIEQCILDTNAGKQPS